MMREPAATTQSRQVRVASNILTMDDFMTSLFGCVNSRSEANRGFAQSLLINVDGHGVIGGL
jgi:hypothetical protein